MAYRHNRNNGRHRPYPVKPPSPSFDILNKVQAQRDFRRNLILLKTPGLDVPFNTLQNSVDCIGSTIKMKKTVIQSEEGQSKVAYNFKYILMIDNEEIAEGIFSSESEARKVLAVEAIAKLQKTCFTVVRKCHPRDSPQVDYVPSSAGPKSEESGTSAGPSASVQELPESSLKGGIGEKMMRKMGWAGTGLGASEQGRTNLIENYIQVDRQGLGSKNIIQNVTKILQKHVTSRSINSIAFSNDFSKEERSQIHQVARKLNLKSKSYGSGDNRILVVQRKMPLIALVKHLLSAGGENEQYQLLLPTDFIP